MSLIVFPFKREDPAVVESNLRTAARHPRVEAVWAVAAGEGEDLDTVAVIGRQVAADEGKPVEVFPQERIGRFRSGKGDGMNTALRHAATAGSERVHFYDADITNFGPDWIDGAEDRADRGHAIVRHRFPRAATDAMITWMVTRPGLAMLFPGTLLPRLGQPLGGELLLSGEAVARLASDPLVTARSDWGIDTVITYTTSAMGLPLYEHLVPTGKRHALYGSLDEIRTMVLECLDAVRSLRGLPRPDSSWDADPPAPVPEDLKRTVAYDVTRTEALLTAAWTEEEVALAEGMPEARAILANRDRPNYLFMDAELWGGVLRILFDRFVLGDPAWEGLAFRLWAMRVLCYTTTVATRGYDAAMEYLEGTIRDYETRPA
ncbi:MAG: hypothetical protein DIU67_000475 [Actinomycetes bacterium]|jgi:mannosylglycerate synthase